MRTARDAWILPYLEPLLTPTDATELRTSACDSYWEEAVRRTLVTDAQIVRALAGRFQMKVADVARPARQARDVVSEQLARKYGALPLAVSDATVDVAVSDPRDLDCERTLAFATGRRVRLSLASPREIAERIDELYSPERVVERILDTLDQHYEVTTIDDAEAPNESDQPIVRLVDHILAAGITARASDIHLESEETGIAVRHRVDGVLRHAMSPGSRSSPRSTLRTACVPRTAERVWS
jgi:type II secretory ATPase GspE/PulE/Tfp pilus assembly ATPase PilB-like protein